MKKSINKIPFWMILLLVTFYSCQQEESPLSERQGTVSLGKISLEFTPMGTPESRISGNSPWVHVFPNLANLDFINKATGQQYVLEYNPNDFSTPNNITLPYGVYEYHTIVEGGIFSAFLPFEAKGEFNLDSQSLEISLEATTDYGLVTVKDQYVEKASISDGKKETNLVEHQDGEYWFLYVKGGTAATLNIIESFQGSTIGRELNIAANRHYNFVLKLNEGAAAITDLILARFELEEEEILLASGSAFFEENGTIKCPTASPGDKGMVNDKMYEAVDRALLIQRRDEDAELTCVCTSLVTDMNGMFSGFISNRNKFDQDISSWDVSNTVDMSSMFYCSDFNQNINNWDVGNVKNMNQMFSIAQKFNQPLDSWDVSNVWDMSYMFYTTNSFNQPIGNWDVGQVRNMEFMFSSASKFNQPIGNWNVSMVENMSWMFENISFNQPIENWNVSNVTNMNAMFQDTDSFNQPIGNWDVSNVTDMSQMFQSAWAFNQPIGDWDVGKVKLMNYMFDGADIFNHPIGNWNVSNVTIMQGMFSYAQKFNQSIGNWDVGKVTDMDWMFSEANSFNQPIGNWEVSNVTDMNYMFTNAKVFNQDLSEWCVQNITSEPTDFSTESALLDPNKPVWGICPE